MTTHSQHICHTVLSGTLAIRFSSTHPPMCIDKLRYGPACAPLWKSMQELVVPAAASSSTAACLSWTTNPRVRPAGRTEPKVRPFGSIHKTEAFPSSVASLFLHRDPLIQASLWFFVCFSARRHQGEDVRVPISSGYSSGARNRSCSRRFNSSMSASTKDVRSSVRERRASSCAVVMLPTIISPAARL